MADQIAQIPIDQILEPRAIMSLVNKDTVEYFELRDSIAQQGILSALCVRPSQQEPGKYELIAGLHRLTASKDVGLSSVPCIIKEGVDEDDFLLIQIQENAIRRARPTVEYARHLRTILTRNPKLTLPQLAKKLNKHPNWLDDVLGLTNLHPTVQAATDRGQIPIQSAYMMAKIRPRDKQLDFLKLAAQLPVAEFRSIAAGVIKECKEAIRQGKLIRHFVDFTPQPYLRSLSHVRREAEHPVEAPLVIAAEGCKTDIDIWVAALNWASNCDSHSVALQRQKFISRTKSAIESEDDGETD